MQTLFKYWHVAHLPFALIMAIILIIHVAIAFKFWLPMDLLISELILEELLIYGSVALVLFCYYFFIYVNSKNNRSILRQK